MLPRSKHFSRGPFTCRSDATPSAGQPVADGAACGRGALRRFFRITRRYQAVPRWRGCGRAPVKVNMGDLQAFGPLTLLPLLAVWAAARACQAQQPQLASGDVEWMGNPGDTRPAGPPAVLADRKNRRASAKTKRR